MRFDEGCTRKRFTPSLRSFVQWWGANGARLSHLLFSSLSKPTMPFPRQDPCSAISCPSCVFRDRFPNTYIRPQCYRSSARPKVAVIRTPKLELVQNALRKEQYLVPTFSGPTTYREFAEITAKWYSDWRWQYVHLKTSVYGYRCQNLWWEAFLMAILSDNTRKAF